MHGVHGVHDVHDVHECKDKGSRFLFYFIKTFS